MYFDSPLFSYLSSIFNSVLPHRLLSKFSTSVCYWILDFLSGRTRMVNLNNSWSQRWHTTLHAYPCGFALAHPSNTIIKFADDTRVVGLISEGDEWALGWGGVASWVLQGQQSGPQHHQDHGVTDRGFQNRNEMDIQPFFNCYLLCQQSKYHFIR